MHFDSSTIDNPPPTLFLFTNEHKRSGKDEIENAFCRHFTPFLAQFTPFYFPLFHVYPHAPSEADSISHNILNIIYPEVFNSIRKAMPMFSQIKIINTRENF